MKPSNQTRLERLEQATQANEPARLIYTFYDSSVAIVDGQEMPLEEAQRLYGAPGGPHTWYEMKISKELWDAL